MRFNGFIKNENNENVIVGLYYDKRDKEMKAISLGSLNTARTFFVPIIPFWSGEASLLERVLQVLPSKLAFFPGAAFLLLRQCAKKNVPLDPALRLVAVLFRQRRLGCQH